MEIWKFSVWWICFQSLSRVGLFATPWKDAASQASLSFTVSWSLLKLMSVELVTPSNHISSSVVPVSSYLQSFNQHQGFFQWVSSLHQVAKVLELQHQSFQWLFRTDFLEDWLVWSPCSPRNSQESSLTPQFKSINSSVLSLLHSPTLTFIRDYWKKHSFDYVDLCQQNNISAF